MSNLTFAQTIKDKTINTYNYLKHDGARNSSTARVTGQALQFNLCDNLLVIDVDIKHDLSDDEKESIRNDFITALAQLTGTIIVQSANGGLHIYCLRNGYESTNRNVKWYQSEKYDIDLFSSDYNKEKRSLLVLPPTKVRDEHKKIKTYIYIKGGVNTTLTNNAAEVIQTLTDAELLIDNEHEKRLSNLLKEIEEGNDKFKSLEDEALDFIDDEPQELNENVEVNNYKNELLVIQGFKGLEIHNDGGNRSIQKEITLFTLFPALNCLPEKVMNYAYEYIKCNAKLTSQALEKWDTSRTRYINNKSTIYTLIKMLRIHNNQYYKQHLEAIYDKPSEIKTIRKDDDFTWLQLVKNCEDGTYITPNECISDMTRLMRVYDTTNTFWIVKDEQSNIRIVSDETQHKKLFRVKCCDTNLWQLYLDNSSKFRVSRLAFNDTTTPGAFNIFNGFRYEPVENTDKLNVWTQFVKEIVCNNNEELYQYVQHWIAYIINNPGKKTETVLSMGGLQGIGKGTFTKVLCKLFDGYVAPNITKMDEITGQFNAIIEGKMLVFCNELKNVGDERVANFDCLKSVITEYDIIYNEKGVPRRNGENNANFIMMSNNAYAVKVEIDDRRYVCFNLSPAKRGNKEYWTKINKYIEDDEFIKAVMFDYVNNYKDDDFNLHDIPETQERKDLIDASKSDIVLMIEDHYKDFIKGTMIYENWKPSGMKPKTFGIQIAKYCDKKKSTARDDTRNKMIYTLKKEWVELLNDNQVDNEGDEDAF